MLRRNRFSCVPIASVFCLLVNLLFADLSPASPLSITGPDGMSVNSSSDLGVTGGTGPYTWSIVAGDGNINNTTGNSTTYTSPTSNPYCASNPTICVEDATGERKCQQIAVNAVSGTLFVAAKQVIITGLLSSCCAGPIYAPVYWWQTDLYSCDGTFNRAEDVSSMCQKDFCIYDPRYDHCYTTAGMCRDQDHPVDIRDAYMKSQGCCPPQLPGGGGGSSSNSGGGTNDMGGGGGNNGCIDLSANLETESSANIKSGNLYHDQKVGKLALSYNSVDTIDGPVGKKWTHNYNQKLTILSGDATLILKTGDGNIIYFHLSAGIYYPEAISGDTSLIVKNANNTYTRTLKNGTIQIFSAIGLLATITDRNGKTTTLNYSGSNLANLIDPNGRTTTITTTSGKITGITDPAGRNYTLAYTGDLTPEEKLIQYFYPEKL